MLKKIKFVLELKSKNRVYSETTAIGEKRTQDSTGLYSKYSKEKLGFITKEQGGGGG